MTDEKISSTLFRLRKIAQRGRALEHRCDIRYRANQAIVMLNIIERRLELGWWEDAEGWILKLRAVALEVLSRANCPRIRSLADSALRDADRLRCAADKRGQGINE